VLAFSLFAFANEDSWLAELTSSVRSHLLIAGAVAVVLGGVTRSVAATALGTAAIVVNLIVLAPLYTGGQPAPASGDRLLVAHVNMQGRDGDLDELERVLGEHRPDVLVVLEPSTDWRALPGRRVGQYAVYSDPDSTGVLVLARSSVTDVRQPRAQGLPDTSLTFEVSLAGRAVRFLALHTISPLTPSRKASRDTALRGAGVWAARHDGSKVVLGDLNATPWSRAVDRLEAAGGLRNSADGFGIQSTWPAVVGALGIPIDEVLTSPDLTTVARSTGPTFGSTHRSLWVTIAPVAPG
jgi:endonuclease/exonuclease/phosphatase (EEP) superfamily protein YafD